MRIHKDSLTQSGGVALDFRDYCLGTKALFYFEVESIILDYQKGEWSKEIHRPKS